MRSISSWARPLVFMASFALLALIQAGCTAECADQCSAEYEECVGFREIDPATCAADFDACLEDCQNESI